MGTLQIAILGSSFAIKANEDDSYLKKLLNHYTEITKQLETESSLTDSLQISILSGIMVCDELYKEKSKQHFSGEDQSPFQTNDAEQRIIRMIQKLDKALS